MLTVWILAGAFVMSDGVSIDVHAESVRQVFKSEQACEAFADQLKANVGALPAETVGLGMKCVQIDVAVREQPSKPAAPKTDL